MKVNETNIEKILHYLGFKPQGVGRHYLEDMLLERAYYESNDWEPHYTNMVRNVSRMNEVAMNSLRVGIRTYIAKSVIGLPANFPRNKRVFVQMLAGVPLASIVEQLYTLMVNTEEEDYE